MSAPRLSFSRMCTTFTRGHQATPSASWVCALTSFQNVTSEIDLFSAAFGDMGTFPRGDTSLFLTLRLRKVSPSVHFVTISNFSFPQLLRPEDYPDMVIHAGDFMYPFGNYGMVSVFARVSFK